MKLLTQPREFVMDELGTDVNLIYGDISGSYLVLYSTHPLNGYRKNGDVYVKKMSLSDNIVTENQTIIPSRKGYCFPRKHSKMVKKDGKFVIVDDIVEKPEVFERALFGANGSFAYVASTEIIKKMSPKDYGFLMEKEPFALEMAPDIILTHEGTHVAFHPYIDIITPSFLNLVPDKVKDYREGEDFYEMCKDSKIETLDEAVSIIMEKIYMMKFHPELSRKHADWRSTGLSPPHREAYHLSVVKPVEVNEMKRKVKELNMEKSENG